MINWTFFEIFIATDAKIEDRINLAYGVVLAEPAFRPDAMAATD